MKGNGSLLESRLKKYTKSTAEYRRPVKKNAALLFTASAAAGLGALICPPPAESAVQYSGLQGLPIGTSVTPAMQLLDLDGDAQLDFTFAFLNYEYNLTFGPIRVNNRANGFLLKFPSGNSVISEDSAIKSSTYLLPARLPGNYTIQGSLPASGGRQWKSTSSTNSLAITVQYYAAFHTSGESASIITSTNFSGGNFIGKKGYLGVRFQISGNTHYGWIRFAADEDMKSGRIVDWAYEDQPDTPIKAGAGKFNWNLFMPGMLNGAKNTP